MANFVVPQMPEICKNAGVQGTDAIPFLDALYSYVVEDRSDKACCEPERIPPTLLFRKLTSLATC
eukprot:6467882-Amphidinium_carterae.1